MRAFISAWKPSWVTFCGLMLMMVVMPRAKNMPASVTMKGCISNLATRKPCTRPKARPMPSASRMVTKRLPVDSRKTTQAMTTREMTPPTEMSMPPQIMTMVSEQATMMSAALLLSMSNTCCGRRKPPPQTSMASM